MKIPKNINLDPLTGRVLRADDTPVNVIDDFGSVKTIGIENSSVHEGVAFTYSTTGTLASGASAFMLGRVGAIGAHISGFFVKGSGGPLTIEFFESPTVTNPGTAQTPVARNRVESNASAMSVYVGSTVSATGTQLLIGVIYSSQHTAASENLPGEWMLKPNTDYAFKVTNNSNQSLDFAAGFNWLEIPTN